MFLTQIDEKQRPRYFRFIALDVTNQTSGSGMPSHVFKHLQTGGAPITSPVSLKSSKPSDGLAPVLRKPEMKKGIEPVSG
jgi:hypothetical protein